MLIFQRVIDAMTVGAVLSITNITEADTEREAIKNYFTDFAPVAWVDFDTGDTKVKDLILFELFIFVYKDRTD